MSSCLSPLADRVLPIATVLSSLIVSNVGGVPVTTAQEETLRPMTFLDVQLLARPGSWTPSPDGAWMLYTVEAVDWKEGKRHSDIHLVSMEQGMASSRPMTFTPTKDESSPAWARDGSFFVFTSNRDADKKKQKQLYSMRPDGGEARRLTDAKEGISDFAFSRDGRWLAYRSGEKDQEQLHRLPIDALFSAEPEQLTDGSSGVEDWEWAPDSQSIYFTRAEAHDPNEAKRRKKGFTVDIRNLETSSLNLWRLMLEPRETTRLTDDPTLSVSSFEVSKDGRWVTFTGGSAKRYERNITGARLYADPFLLEVATGQIERLAENYEVGESGLSISPDGRWVVFSAPDDMTRYTMTENRIYLRQAAKRGEPFRKLGQAFDGSLRVGFWSEDGNTLYFNAGVRVTTQLHALDLQTGKVRQVTEERAAVNVRRDDDSGRILISYSDPQTPPTVFTVSGEAQVADRTAWTQLVDANPQVREMALGEESEIEWRSTDGKSVGGILVKPVGYREGTRYPLIVAIHGGPASADVLRFNGGYGAQVYAGAGYAVLKPNYRGSRNYGNAHRTDIVGDYFTLGFDDIMTGVDHLIEAGIADGDRLGALGWSAGGHWSNWILTHTNRFKAISSGAGTMNWISMYAQSDVQRNRQFYIGDDFLYENFDPYWNQSPLKYIKNAQTPTMVHVVEGDRRVPSPQAVELHMALKKLGIPTELFMYPGKSHSIPDPRNRLVKSVSEMAWMDYYVRGVGDKFQWADVLDTVEDEEETPQAEASAPDTTDSLRR
ncbi:MAG: S9 family peptidase [Planctomycetes bacterium]|nr:S9 family peptidase [Planctomycetota bacterium]